MEKQRTGDCTGTTVRPGNENTAAQLQPLITSRCSENEPALLPEKEEKQGRLPFKRNFRQMALEICYRRNGKLNDLFNL